ncbi:glutamate-cysteine ligase family protein [Longimicrobium sp.]|jgi:glutamate--cysteine ligase|uniref:glutamate-cysteine ligase family protein n=1 Tax=Longimicrobium sp. TaxID=2029185 RepID=UPI002ED9520E
MTLDRAALLSDLRENSFALSPARSVPRPRIGAEVELIPVSAESGVQVPIQAADGPSTLPLLRQFAERHCWREEPSSYGVPRFVLPDGGIITYEPGGQIELSAPALPSATALVQGLRAAVAPLTREMREEGVELLSVGIEPRNGLETVPLQLPGARYVRMTEFMQSLGTGGERMMRQTAAMQVSLDFGADPLARWRVWNAMAPYVTAIFASSPVYRGEPTGDRSFRARVWRELDGGRTGCFACDDPVAEYLDFALRAPMVMSPGPGFLSFDEWNRRGCVRMEDWHLHLTTLFPEVRPKGFAEVRSADVVAPEWYAAPLVLLAGIAYHAPSLHAAADLLGDPDPALLVGAGRDGLSDPRIAATAAELAGIALSGAAAMPAFFGGEDIDEAAEFFARYTRQARSPADDILDAIAGSIPA